jgi:KDO2-lipid IV(A) lauroyltransferase
MFFARLISHLPLAILYIISDFLFFVSFYLVRYRRKMVQKNLRNSFPEKSYKERRKIEKDFYTNLCDYAVETLKLLTISKADLLKRVTFKNKEITFSYLENKKSIIFLASHQFNWEWLLAGASLAYPGSLDFVYQSVHSKFFDALSLDIRARFGAYPIKRDQVARESIRRNNITRAVAIVGDQYPGYGRDKKYQTKFLNQDTVFFYGLNQRAYLTQYPAFYHHIRKVRRGHYESILKEVAIPPYTKTSDAVIESYVRAVEKNIREEPASWLWSHNRWKTRHLTQA